MKQFPLIAFSVASMFLFSCQSATKDNTAVETKDSLATTTAAKDSSGVNSYNENTVKLVKLKLTTMLSDDLSKNVVSEASRKFILFEYDLNEDGNKEIFVGLTGPYFCGSGGCTFLLLDHEGQQITKFTVTDFPVLVAGTKTNGWKDLILSSGGKNHLMKFNGKTYPSNPTVQPVFEGVPGNDLPKFPGTVNGGFPWVSF
ncbi:hypothetical protein DBR43_17325 [Pedobacter sp. KBW06]|uniref:hypothetical protein n=1 Tax=Pedobacter sp. KBW06 TaxID=2153359 RepID=UPI000F59C6EA|nr:hypothetical protein [Pedobacter sp. KBW06]RQO69818.1 hypothetical protein DBR43_17325 [Pedobacter sp. KBW06]